jgi:membrane protein DedA with SNARE-associated domain
MSSFWIGFLVSAPLWASLGFLLGGSLRLAKDSDDRRVRARQGLTLRLVQGGRR